MSIRWHIFGLAMTVALFTGGMTAWMIYQQSRATLGGRVEEALWQYDGLVAKTIAEKLDGDLVESVYRSGNAQTADYLEVQKTLRFYQKEFGIDEDIYTLHRAGTQTRFGVSCKPTPLLGHTYRLRNEMNPVFDGKGLGHTDLYQDDSGWWVSSYAPVRKRDGTTVAIVAVDHNLDAYVRDTSARTLKSALTAMSLALLVALVLTFLLSGKIVGPLRRIANAAEALSSGKAVELNLKAGGSGEVGTLSRFFTNVLLTFDELAKHLGRVAQGDLSQTVEIEGNLAKALNQMILKQRKLVTKIQETAVQLSTTSAEFFATAQQQERGAVNQTTAVEENLRTMEALFQSGGQISAAAEGVLKNAEQTLQNSQMVSQRIMALASQTHRIAEILGIIRDIANKSEILALNAALEGTRAGEAGKGFSLVATQMQRLAENVMASVADIQELTRTIANSTQSAVLAIEENTSLAGDTTTSARRIALIIRQQQTDTAQVKQALDDVALVARESTQGSKQVVASTKEVVNLAERLETLVGQFQLEKANVSSTKLSQKMTETLRET